MIKILQSVDRVVCRALNMFCMSLLLAMVCFTVYTVVMRYLFGNPPVWGDLLTVLSNIWLVFIALALTVREKDMISLNMIYTYLPLRYAFILRQIWMVMIFLMGILILMYGLEVIDRMGGKYWEMWHFAWEEGGFVFKPHYMPKKYAVVILPISGFLVSLASLVTFIQDSVKFRKGTYKAIDEHLIADV